MRRRVAVLGSNSFSGSDFVDLLLETGRYSVLGVSRSPEKSALFLPYRRRNAPDFTFRRMDLNRDPDRILELLDAFRPECVVNFAAQSEVAPSWENPGQWFRTNAVAVALLADALKDRSYLERYVHISSPEVYGTCSGIVREDASLNPSTPYAASKAAGDLSLFPYVKHFGFPMTMIRSTNVYGAHQQLYKIIPRSIVRLKQGRRIPLHGGGVAVKSFIHVRDVSRGELAAMERGRTGEIYHLSPDRGRAVREVVGMVCEAMGRDFAASTEDAGERLGQDAAYVIDSSKARKELDWRPETTFRRGIADTIRWIETNWEQVLREPGDYVHQA